MQKKIICCALILSLAWMTACAPVNPVKNPGKLQVYTSFFVLYDFARKIGGELIDVANLVPAGTEPHDWEPAAADLVHLETADVLIYNGAGMESWVDQVVDVLANKRQLLAVDTSSGISLLADAHQEADTGTQGYDPHIWLSPVNAGLQMKAIRDALIQADPANRAAYEANYARYAGEIETLDAEFRETLTALPKKEIIVAHQAFGYLCAEYGLVQVAIEGLTADSEPDPARMAEIVDFARKHDVKVIFFEELVSPKVAEAIAEEIQAKTAVLNPLEGLSDEQLAAGDDYFSVMRQNLAALAAALS